MLHLGKYAIHEDSMGNFDEAYVSGIGTAAVRLNNHGSQMKGFPGAGRVFFLMWNHTVDGSGIPKNHLAWNGAKTLKIMVDKLPTSTGFHAGVQPSTVWPHLIKIPRCLLVRALRSRATWLGFFPWATQGAVVVVVCCGQSLGKKLFVPLLQQTPFQLRHAEAWNER